MRLKDYDYSQNGAYFITICTNNRELLFEPEEVKEMISNVWNELEKKYNHIVIDDFIVMPNHIHGILFIVGADLRVCPNNLGSIVRWFKTMTTNYYIKGIKDKGWISFNVKLWQRNYYEHVIRNEDELRKSRKYIKENPLKWELDEDNPENLKKRANT